MRGTKAKMLRKAAEYERPATYEKPEMKRVIGMPVFETHERTIREMGPGGKITSRVVTKYRYGKDGKTPLHPILQRELDAKTGKARFVPQMQLVPITKPRRLALGSPRRVYQTLKTLERREGLDVVFARMEKEVVA